MALLSSNLRSVTTWKKATPEVTAWALPPPPPKQREGLASFQPSGVAGDPGWRSSWEARQGNRTPNLGTLKEDAAGCWQQIEAVEGKA